MVRLGIIGFGRMGITHFSIMRPHPDVTIGGVCDASSTVLGLLRQYVDVETYTDVEEMLQRAQLDAVIISTPTDSHAALIERAVRAGLHVFVEKPFTLDPADGERIIAMAEERGLVHQVGYVNRFNEVFVEAKRLLDAGLIGEVVDFSAEMYGRTVIKPTGAGWRSSRETGGGCLYEFASHCIDLVVYVLGPPDTVAGSVLQRIYSADAEDLVRSTFTYRSGACGHIAVNWSDPAYRKPANLLTLNGTKGKIIADKHMLKVFLNEPAPEHGFRAGWTSRSITDFGRPVRFYVRGNEFTNQLDDFIARVEGKQGVTRSSFHDGHHTDVVMAKIRSDAAQDPDSKPRVRPGEGSSRTRRRRLRDRVMSIPRRLLRCWTE